MNRNNKILVGVLALIVAMTIGYALFSDNITITGTAKAKGDFSITATCKTGLDSRLTLSELGLDPEGGYRNDSCTVSGNTVSISLDLDYLTATRYFTVKMTNSGTIDATLNLSNITESGKICLDGVNSEPNGKIEEDECADPSLSGFSNVNLFDVMPLAAEKSDGTILIDAEDPNFADFMDEDGNLIIKPGNSFLFLVKGSADIDFFGSGGEEGFLITSDISYQFPFTQKVN